jgi:hypothetical protein
VLTFSAFSLSSFCLSSDGVRNLPDLISAFKTCRAATASATVAPCKGTWPVQPRTLT